ncbi:DAK2 domain-containing protein, partial [Candidatus Bathyarchaeota archaeon]|nr:DAK2 domain-containing protein [Candidatus Bathyarchaeota archaeon]
ERVYSGPAETSLNAAGFSISLTNLTAAAKSCAYTANAMKDLLDMRTDTHWESLAGSQAGQRRPRKEQLTQAEPAPQPRPAPEVELRVEPGKLERVLRNACEKLIEAEPDLTRWDTVMGDGDCGETVKTGALALLAALDGEKVAESGSTDTILATLEDVAEGKMGGTLGGILGILFASLRAAIGKDGSDGPATLIWASAVSSALTSLGRYTPATVGDRTIMDTLIPFAEALHTGNFDTAVDAAVNGAESTRKIAPRLGRATYVGVTAGEVLPPDPGAWAAAVAIKGLRDGMS